MFRSSTPILRVVLATRSTIVSSRQFTRKITQNSAQGGSEASTGYTNHGKKSSDTAWLIGSIAVTVPSALYLLYSSPEKNPDHHDSGHHSTPEEGGASSGGETAKSQMDPVPESSSESADGARGQAGEKFGKIGERAGEVSELITEGSENKAHGGDKGSEEDAGKPNQDEGKDSDDSQDKEGADISKEPVGEGKEIEKTGGDSEPSETLSNLNKKQNSSKTPSQVDPPVAAIKSTSSTNETSGKQEGLSNSDTSHAVLHDKMGDAISKKPEGSHQTAKLKGAVDPKRPAT